MATHEAEATTTFLDIAFTPHGLDDACAAIVARADRERPFGYVVTPNVDLVVKLRDEPERVPLFDAAWRRYNDSKILTWLAKRSGIDLPSASGSDIAARLFETAIAPDEPVTIVGGDEALIEQMITRFRLKDVRWHNAPMGLRRDPAAIERAAAFVAAQRARFVFICVGTPQGEMVAKAVLDRGDAVGVGLCIGAALDFLSGRKARAPEWMRASGLEWLHRLLSEPGRLWKRYLVEGPRIFLLWLEWNAARRKSQTLSASI